MRWIGSLLLIIVAVLLVAGLHMVRSEMAEIKAMHHELAGLRLDLEASLARIRLLEPRLEEHLLEVAKARALLDSAAVALNRDRRVLARTRGQLTVPAQTPTGESPEVRRALAEIEKVRGEMERLKGEVELLKSQMPR